MNDPWAASVLRPNARGAGPWPNTVPDIVSTVSAANPALLQESFLVGEGTQIPVAVADRNANRDLRYIITWTPTGDSPTIFLSVAPPGTHVGSPPPFLQVIAFDPKKKRYNYYQYVSNARATHGNDPGQVETWTWAGDTTHARTPSTTGQGCFACHLNGGLNMKELTVPWNNWNSPLAQVSTTVVPNAVAADPLFKALSGGDKFERYFEGAQFKLSQQFVGVAIKNGQVTTVPELLRRLIQTTTVNFASSQKQSAGTEDITGIPNDFFINDSVLNGVLRLSYTVPTLTIDRRTYDAFLAANNFALVNEANIDGPPTYRMPGATFFAFFVPVPAYEDVKAINELCRQNVITPRFAAALLMVDFPNPIFSRVRSSLMTYASQIIQGKLAPDKDDVPTQFAALVTKAAAGQPPPDLANITRSTAEQQFLYYYNQPNWQKTCTDTINGYLAAVGRRLAAQAGANDYLTLSVSRGLQFAGDPLVGPLDEIELLLPQTSNILMQMNADGTVTAQSGH